MYFNKLCNYVFSFTIENEIKGGIFTGKKNGGTHNGVLPPKNEPLVSQNVINIKTLEYVDYKNEIKVFMDASYNATIIALSPAEKYLLSGKELKEVSDTLNNEIKKNNFHDKIYNGEITLETKEEEERKSIHTEACVLVAEKVGLINAANVLMKDYFTMNKVNDNYRSAASLFMLGCNSLDDLFKDYEILVNGSNDEKANMFKNKLEIAKKTRQALTAQMKTDREYLNFFKDNMINVFSLNELDNDKVPNALAMFNTTMEEEYLSEFKKDNNGYASFGATINILGTMANPYYPKLKTEAYLSFDGLSNDRLGAVIDNKAAGGSKKYKNCSKLFNEKDYLAGNLSEANKEGAPLIDHFNGYCDSAVFQTSQMFDPNNAMLKDYIESYLSMHKPITAACDSEGKDLKNDKDELANSIANELKKKNPVLLYDKLGNLITMVNIPNPDTNPIPMYYNDTLNIDFKHGQLNAIQSLKKEFSKLESIFSSDHDEFKAVKAHINSMEQNYKTGKNTMSTLCGNLRKLASDYVESKYSEQKWDKTERTYQREEFMLKLIATIDKSYPIEYPVEVNRIRVENLEELTENDLMNLEEIKKISSSNLEKHEIEDKLDNFLTHGSK